jgi:hypothetical protein
MRQAVGLQQNKNGARAPRALPWAGMNQAFGLRAGMPIRGCHQQEGRGAYMGASYTETPQILAHRRLRRILSCALFSLQGVQLPFFKTSFVPGCSVPRHPGSPPQGEGGGSGNSRIDFQTVCQRGELPPRAHRRCAPVVECGSQPSARPLWPTLTRSLTHSLTHPSHSPSPGSSAAASQRP